MSRILFGMFLAIVLVVLTSMPAHAAWWGYSGYYSAYYYPSYYSAYYYPSYYPTYYVPARTVYFYSPPPVYVCPPPPVAQSVVPMGPLAQPQSAPPTQSKERPIAKKA